jgi:hypothetical protein
MNSDSSSLLKKNWTAAELRNLAAAERDAILEAAARWRKRSTATIRG